MKWVMVDDKDMVLTTPECIFRLHYIRTIRTDGLGLKNGGYSLQIRPKTETLFQDLGYLFLTEEPHYEPPPYDVVDRKQWTNIHNLVGRTTEILMSLGYIETVPEIDTITALPPRTRGIVESAFETFFGHEEEPKSD